MRELCHRLAENGASDEAGVTDVGHLDGLTYFWYGNWILKDKPEGWRIITTPNSSWIPFPNLLYRDVYLRQDGFLGREDPILLPQLYDGSLPHLACISVRGSESSDARFFREGIDIEFIDPPTSFPRRCELPAAAKSRCNAIWNRLKLEYTSFVARNGKDRHKRLETITSQFEIGSGSVMRFQGMYLELMFRFAILCHLYIEIEAYRLHHELLESHEFSMDVRPVDRSLVGTITTDETVCYRFHRMGVPVWLNRPLAPNSATLCRLFTEKIPLHPDFQKISPSGVDVVVARVPNVRPIFEGASDDASYLACIADWIRDFFRIELGDDQPLWSFFASYQRKPRPPRGRGVEVSKKRKPDDLNNKVKSKRAKKGQAQMMNSARVQSGPMFSPIRYRSHPLTARTDLNQLLEYATPKPSGTWETVDGELGLEPKSSLRLAPTLDVFTNVDSALQLKRFIYVWLKVKDRWLLKVGEELQPPEFANRRAWRTFMRGSFDLAPIKPESEAGKSRLRFADYLGLSEPLKFDIDNTRFGLGPPGHLDKTVDKTVIRNALHEINEINFLHDIYEVELRRTWDLPSAIINRLERIAGDNKNPFADPSPLSRRTTVERLRWITALRDIVQDWPTSSPKPRGFDLEPRATASGPRVDDLLTLELAVGRYYSHVAEGILGRRPTIPLYR